MNGNERKAATRNHALALEQEIGRIHTPNVTTGHDTDFVNFIVVGKEIDGGRRDDHRRLVIYIKGAPGHWLYDCIGIRWRGYPPMLSFSTAI